MSDAKEDELEAVPERARRAREILTRWGWVEPTVWTERMLTALDEGVKGGVWYSLMDKVHPERVLRAAYFRVAANKGAAGVDHVTVTMFEDRLEENLKDLSDALRTGTYRPQAIRRHWIPKPGSQEKRPLGIPTVRDRVVQTALRQVLEPIYERDFATHSYGFRPGKGCKDALRRVDELLKGGYTHVVDADLKSYFDTIPHDRLLALVAKKVSDGKVLNLIDAFLHQGVLDGLDEWTPEQGTPQGAVISPLLSNIYLDPLDHLMAESGFAMVRYADDFVILCRSCRGSGPRPGSGATMDGVGRPDAASDQDASHRRWDRRLRLPGLPIRGWHPPPATKEPGQAQGHGSGDDATDLRPQPLHDHQAAQSDASRLVWIFPTQPPVDVSRTR